MYSPTTRLLTVLELLQSYPAMSGAELARRLEVDVRTIRRYIVMLLDMGIPVEAERGPHGAYRLRRGYKLPPLMFTDAEAISLTLGLLAIREYQFPVDVAAVEGALAKTERVMPEKLLAQAQALQEAITFKVPRPPVRFQNDVIAPLSLAVRQRKRVWLRYRSWSGEESERLYDPYGILFNEGVWYTSGFCHLRGDLRTFRIDRIVALEPRDGAFERPADFDMEAHVLQSTATAPGVEHVEVLMQTTPERAREVTPPLMGTLEAVEGGVMFRRSVFQLGWIARFLIELEFPVQVLRPQSLKDMLREMARRALRMIGDES